MFDNSAAKIFRTGGREGGYWCCLSGICWDTMLFYNHILLLSVCKEERHSFDCPSSPLPPSPLLNPILHWIESKPYCPAWFFILNWIYSFYSIAVGLEVIGEGTTLESDSDIGHYLGGDLPDPRKLILQMQQLNSRVNELERNVEHNSVGFWSKMIFFTFTIINPILLHWLFWRRRWRNKPKYHLALLPSFRASCKFCYTW